MKRIGETNNKISDERYKGSRQSKKNMAKMKPEQRKSIPLKKILKKRKTDTKLAYRPTQGSEGKRRHRRLTTSYVFRLFDLNILRVLRNTT